VALYAVSLGLTIAHASSRPLTARYLAAAVAYLCIVVSLGLTAALNFQLGFLGPGIARLLPTHIALGVVGWLSTMVIGVSYQLVRMFALTHGHDDRLGRGIFWLLNGGLIALALAFALAWLPLLLIGGVTLVAGVGCFAYDYWRMLRARRRRPLDITQRHGIAAVVYLALVMPLALGVAALSWGRGAASAGVLAALGLAALVGWLGQSTIGYLYKIVPFLIWNARFGPLVGMRKVPLMRDMVHERWAEASWWLINVGLPVAALALAVGWVWPLRVAGVALGAGLALAAANILAVALYRHAQV
jgi:hypothetical protein